MLRVTVDLLPGGEEAPRRRLGTLRIARDGGGDSGVASYDVELDDVDGAFGGRVDRYQRDRGFWPLVVLAIEACIGEVPDPEADH